MTLKEYEGTYWDDRNILYLERSMAFKVDAFSKQIKFQI
jgi:hypothetical protein